MDSLATAKNACDAFRSIAPNIGTQTVSAFLTIAKYDGRLIVSDLERLCSMSRESASRNAKYLRVNYGLIETFGNDKDTRVKYMRLTQAGHDAIATITRSIAA